MHRRKGGRGIHAISLDIKEGRKEGREEGRKEGREEKEKNTDEGKRGDGR